MPKSPTFLGNFCKGYKIYHFSSEIKFWATFIDIWRFLSGHTGQEVQYLLLVHYSIVCAVAIFGLMGGVNTDQLRLAPS